MHSLRLPDFWKRMMHADSGSNSMYMEENLANTEHSAYSNPHYYAAKIQGIFWKQDYPDRNKINECYF